MVCWVLRLLAALAGWAAVGQSHSVPPVLNHYPSASEYRYIKRLEARLSTLENSVDTKFSLLENVVTDLARQECQTGSARVQLCPGFQEADLAIVTLCVSTPQLGGLEPIQQDFPIDFNPPFMNTPVVELSFSGQALVLGKNCSVEVSSVEEGGFVFTYLADDLYPVASDVTWLACPSALLQPGQPLSGLLGSTGGQLTYANFQRYRG